MNLTEIVVVSICILIAVVIVALFAACSYDSNTRSIPKPNEEDDKENKDE